MAIIIPSTKIYEIDNPKVRDNIIERIEVNAKEIVPNNEFNISVYNKEYSGFNSVIKEYKYDFQKTYKSAPDNLNFIIAMSYSGYKETKLSESYKIIIPKALKKSTIVKVNDKIDKNGQANIKYSLYGTYKYGTITCDYTGELKYISGQNYNLIINYDIQNSIEDEGTSKKQAYFIPDNISNLVEGAIWQGNKFDIQVSSKITVEQTGNLKTADIKEEIIDGIEYFTAELNDILAGIKFINMGGTTNTNAGVGTGYPFSGIMSGVWKEYVPDYLEITIYGDTIGIDLKEKTIYIPENDKTSKKVFSVEGNELMQTSNFGIGGGEIVERKLSVGTDFIYNYTDTQNLGVIINFLNTNFVGKEVRIRLYEDNPDAVYKDFYYIISSNMSITINWGYHIGEVEVYLREEGNANFIKKSFSKTQELYNNGKETATIRCGISDYYDENGNRQISYESGECFNIYDEVIPYVCGKFGVDKPMSVDKNGNPKVFRVLGREIYYDGAIFQKLFLQEA